MVLIIIELFQYLIREYISVLFQLRLLINSASREIIAEKILYLSNILIYIYKKKNFRHEREKTYSMPFSDRRQIKLRRS